MPGRKRQPDRHLRMRDTHRNGCGKQRFLLQWSHMSEKNICPKVKVQGLSAHQSSGCLSPNLWCTLTMPSVRSDGLANCSVDVDKATIQEWVRMNHDIWSSQRSPFLNGCHHLKFNVGWNIDLLFPPSCRGSGIARVLKCWGPELIGRRRFRSKLPSCAVVGY